MPRYSKSELPDLLRQFYNETGKYPTSEAIRDHSDYPSPTTYYKEFESWDDALEAAGFDVFHESGIDYYNRALEQGSCLNCDESRVPCLQFHHKDPSKKEAGVPQLALNGGSIEAVYEEASKCVLLCANCHNLHHSPDADFDASDYPKAEIPELE